MKTHTQTYKENLVKLGKEINAKVIYTINGVQTELDGDMLGSVTPHYEGAILKSVMKQVDIVSDVDIPLNTEINVQFGLKFDDENYEYVDYGNYIVFSSEKQEDTNNYKIIAYDKMLYAMKDYEQLVGTNLFDKETMIINSTIDSSNGNMTESDNFRTIAFKCQPSTTYTIKKILSNRFVIGYSTDDDTNMPKTLTNIQGSVSHTSETFTTNNDTNYVFIMISKITDDTTPLEDLLDSIQIQEGTSQEIFENVYPITIRDYLNILCTKLNLEFANSNDTFTNYDKEITQELYKDLGYTYRDVLDELAQVTASTICINKDDKLEIRYINDLDNELQEVEGTNLTISDAQDTKLKGVQVEGNTTQNGTPTPTTPIPISNVSGLQEVEITNGTTTNTYEINLGKQLFNFDDTHYFRFDNASTLSKTNNVITFANSLDNNRGFVWWNIPVKIGKQISISYSSIIEQTENSANGVCYLESDTPITSYVADINNSTQLDKTSKKATITTTKQYLVLILRARNINSISVSDLIVNYGTPTTYAEYFTPIELNKISTYKDFIFKGKGVNYIDVNNLSAYNSGWVYYIDNPFKESGTYTYSFTNTSYFGNTSHYFSLKFGDDYTASSSSQLHAVACNTSSYSFNITNEMVSKKYLCLYPNASGLLQYIKDSMFMIQEGTSVSPYEPYNAKDKWLLHKEIGKVVLNGTPSWRRSGTKTSGNYYFFEDSLLSDVKFDSNNRFIGIANMGITTNTYQEIQGFDTIYHNNTYVRSRFYSDTTKAMSTSEFATWLSSHNIITYYVLANPTTTEITNSEVINGLNKLEKAKLYQGVTNISSTFPIKLSYASDYETIDEDYIKNTRADFGEKYGPVNSIVLSRSADTDNVYIQDEDSIEENGLCEIKIKDNQILNDNNRSDFLPGLLDQLGGIEYYTNNFESIGITYLDLCDRYKVKIEDNIYDCIMFNNEVEIGDGLNEIIYTDKPEITQTDYKKASKTDKQERQTYLIVDKQNEKIEAFVGDIEGEFASINFNVNGISTRVQGLESNYTGIEGQISGIVSSISEQTSKAITDWFDLSLKTRIENVESTSTTNQEEITKIQAYIRRGVITDTESPYFGQAYVEIGDDTNETTLRILKNRIQFLTNGVETAFISNNQLYINESTILTKEKVGHWVTTEDDNGLLNTYWEE